MQRAEPSHGGSRDRQNGFTLIEVLVAFLILAAGTLVVQQAVMVGLRGSEQANDRLQAELVARSLLSAPLPASPTTSTEAPTGMNGTLDGHAWTIRFEPLRLPFPTGKDADGKAPAWIPLRMVVTVALTPRRSWSPAARTVRLETVRLVKGPAS